MSNQEKEHLNEPTRYNIYLNGYWFDSLEIDYNDRPEPYRMLQKSLWTIYELTKLGTHEIAIVNEDKQLELKTKRAWELRSWLMRRYPRRLLDHLGGEYSSSPHPADLLRKQ
jgi:hypothetical protein